MAIVTQLTDEVLEELLDAGTGSASVVELTGNVIRRVATLPPAEQLGALYEGLMTAITSHVSARVVAPRDLILLEGDESDRLVGRWTPERERAAAEERARIQRTTRDLDS